MAPTMKTLALATLATAAIAASPANAFTLYSEMPTQGIAVETMVNGASACALNSVRAMRYE